MIGRLSEGFAWQELGVALITEEEIFGRKVHRPSAPRSKAAPFLSTFKELKPGDFVVHTDYGVGEYQGLTHISVDGFETDFLTLRYEPDAKLYVPLYSLDKVQKYIGVEGSAPKLDKLGAPAWAKTKEKARKDILEMAQQLVAVYAAREAMQRPSFSPPDNLYREFESAFPYEETPDQQKAIEDVLADMQRPRPMDRVVCGDVGYGKTEVALRAAFKAVEDGYQAAVLVPTTLLADQHFRTFSQRLAPFSIRVDMLSRFRTKAEQKETLKGLKSGTVDMVIGTHRLLQKDIAFKNLGLLVVDEEHKFGVKHKERIKEFKKLVDVLTLTATPIPRTLHMSLAGIRDLSIIQTPPLDRQAIQVVLARLRQARDPRGDHARAREKRPGVLRAQPGPGHRAHGRLHPEPCARGQGGRGPRPAQGRRDRGRDDEVPCREPERAGDHDDHRIRHRHPDGQHDHHQPRGPLRPGGPVSDQRQGRQEQREGLCLSARSGGRGAL